MTNGTRFRARARRALDILPPQLRRDGRQWGTRAWLAVRRLSTPISRERLNTALDQATGGGADVLLVHSSLSRCGHFLSGPDGVLQALTDRCNTLCLPTHTYCYPSRPDEPGPVFDVRTTPSLTGRLTEIFRHRRGVTRSIHATHSLAMSGSLADRICADHYRCDSPCGKGTPYIRLVETRASVLMFGVTFNFYTFFHTAEFLAGSEHAFEHGMLDHLQVIDENGREQECWSRRQSRAPMRFAEAGDLLERVGLARRVNLGQGALLFVPDSSKVHEFMLERLKRTPDFLRQSCRAALR